ncbi:NlpC/P60 family protein [Candidatus Electrothrix laxa]
MKRAIRVGLIVIVLSGGFLLIWKVQQGGWTIQGRGPAEFILNGFDSASVVKVQPFIPPVIEIVDGQQSAPQSGEYPNPEIESIIEIDKEKSPRDEVNSDLMTESVTSIEAKGGEEAIAQNYGRNILNAIFHAEKKASSQALQILQIGRKMSLENREIVQGGCWDYVDTVYNRAGYSEEQRRIVFQGGEEVGQYADREMIFSGDWLFYINHNYREARHSAIFIDWIDYEKHIGLMLSYGGEGRGEPARYRTYDLSHVYNIVRVVEK